MVPSERVTELFADDVLVVSAHVTDVALAAITPREAELVARAVDKRKREFATARALAKAALARFGLHDYELLNAQDRSPIWPAHITGSISHCDTRAVVAVGDRATVGTIGIDVEHRDELKRELWKTVFLREEVDALDAQFAHDVRGRMALALFSAKEALYKAQYPRSTQFMGFHELRVEMIAESATRGRLECEFQNDVGPFAKGFVAHGRYRLDAFPAGEVITAVRIEP
ncbi:Phosphopantetheinyltransferase component of enterobactin synthase multienzyme complex [Sandaracinus amylolyticus]|nr:Phosphopantetheinyltransferase component of enterobactin synthase multienzyme complex [Sandaracinus amylolyticus]